MNGAPLPIGRGSLPQVEALLRRTLSERTITMSASHPTTPARFLALEAATREIDAKRQAGAELRPEIRKR